MTDRNPNHSFRPRDSERYAELSDLLGDIGADVPIAPLDQGFDLEKTPSLESVLANVDANYPLRPREVSLGGLAAPKDWNKHQSAFSRATPLAIPLEPKILDAWDLRPESEPTPSVETDLFELEAVAEVSAPPSDLETTSETASDDEDAFLSALDGLEDDILGDAELSDYAEPFGAETGAFSHVEALEPEVASGGTVEALEAATDEDQMFDVSIFDDLPDLASDTTAAANTITAEQLFEEPEFEDIDFDLPIAPDTTEVSLATSPNSTVLQSTIAATTLTAAGLGAVFSSVRANASREIHADAGELPMMALPSAHKTTANAEALFPNIAAPYDDVPVTGSLKVPVFIAPEKNVPQSSMGFDEFEIDDFKPTHVPAPVDYNYPNATGHAETIVHEPARNQPSVTNEAAGEALDDLDFGIAFDEELSPTDELADLVGSNVATDPLLPGAKDDDFAPMPAMPPIVGARSGRSKWIAIGAFGLALVGGVAIYGLSGGSVATNSEPAIVRADNDPVRVAPENPGGTVVPNQDRVVFNEVGGSSAVPEQPQETLVDGRQEPAIAAAPVKEEDRVLNGDNSAEMAAPQGTAIAPRSVQTVTVRPDGTLVANPPLEQAAAAPQAEIEPETRPQTAAAQPMPEPTNPIAEIAAASVTETPAAETLPVEASLPEAPLAEAPIVEAPVVEETIAAKVPAKVVEIKPVIQKAKVKAPKVAAKTLDTVPSRPSDQPVNIVNGAAPALPEQDATQQTSTVEPTAADALAAGIYAIQIASTPSEGAATSTLRSLSSKYGSILGGKDYAIQRAEVPGKGTMYRVRILAGSKADATKLCSRYKSAGGSCFVTR